MVLRGTKKQSSTETREPFLKERENTFWNVLGVGLTKNWQWPRRGGRTGNQKKKRGESPVGTHSFTGSDRKGGQPPSPE